MKGGEILATKEFYSTAIYKSGANFSMMNLGLSLSLDFPSRNCTLKKPLVKHLIADDRSLWVIKYLCDFIASGFSMSNF